MCVLRVKNAHVVNLLFDTTNTLVSWWYSNSSDGSRFRQCLVNSGTPAFFGSKADML